MRKILPNRLVARVYLFFTVLITLPMLIYSIYSTNETKHTLILEREKQLYTISNILRTRFPNSYHDILERHNALTFSDDDKRDILHKELQPIVKEVAKNYPEYNMGYYSLELGRVAFAPRTDLLGQKAVAPTAMHVYETRQAEVNIVEGAVTRDGITVLAINFPLLDNGDAIGHIWVNYDIRDIIVLYHKKLLEKIVGTMLIWICLMLFAHLFFNYLKKSFIEIIQNGKDDPKILRSFPPLNVIREAFVELQGLKNNLEQLVVEKTEEVVNKERQKLEVLARFDRLNLIGEMAAGIGHEVRNPLTTVRGYLQFFQRKDKFIEYRGQLETMVEELDRAGSIITEFLSLAKNKAVELSLDNLNGTIHALLPLIQAEAFRLGHDVLTDIGDIPSICYDDSEIRQLILNLARNGMEAMDSGGILTIKTYLEKDKVVLVIQDTGTGISKHIQENIGTPFQTTKDNGTGIGLSVCYRIAQRHNAEMDFVTGNNGTTFFIRFDTERPQGYAR
jgi:signal transduction histidine kinase